jgi:hypothetical protein
VDHGSTLRPVLDFLKVKFWSSLPRQLVYHFPLKLDLSPNQPVPHTGRQHLAAPAFATMARGCSYLPHESNCSGALRRA